MIILNSPAPDDLFHPNTVLPVAAEPPPTVDISIAPVFHGGRINPLAVVVPVILSCPPVEILPPEMLPVTAKLVSVPVLVMLG